MQELPLQQEAEEGKGMKNTMTVNELIEKLKEYPGNMPVFAQWEGVAAYVTGDGFFVEFVEKRHNYCVQSLVIDVEDY